MDAYIKFGSHLRENIKALMDPIVKKHTKELGTIILNEIVGDGGPEVINRQASPRELFFKKVFLSYNEISGAFENLENIETYIGRFPYAGCGISRISYLEYHYTNYLQAVYILRERLLAFLRKTCRWYKKDQRYNSIRQLTESLDKTIKNSFSGILKLRGQHVHDRAYTKPEFERLYMLRVFEAESHDLRKICDAIYRDIRHKSKNEVVEMNKAIGDFLDSYFGKLLEIFFDGQGALICSQMK
jgi:hypothetical protein